MKFILSINLKRASIREFLGSDAREDRGFGGGRAYTTGLAEPVDVQVEEEEERIEESVPRGPHAQISSWCGNCSRTTTTTATETFFLSFRRSDKTLNI